MTALLRFGAMITIVALMGTSAANSVLMSLATPVPDGATVPASDTPKQADEKSEMLATSEGLIAAALKAGDITYEESLRQRVFALYADPRLQPRYRSPIVDWDTGMRLFFEVDKKEETLSSGLLKDLAPFRARPNDPISIFNRTPSKKLSRAPAAALAGSVRRVAAAGPAQSGCVTTRKLAEGWESRLVARLGTGIPAPS